MAMSAADVEVTRIEIQHIEFSDRELQEMRFLLRELRGEYFMLWDQCVQLGALLAPGATTPPHMNKYVAAILERVAHYVAEEGHEEN